MTLGRFPSRSHRGQAAAGAALFACGALALAGCGSSSPASGSGSGSAGGHGGSGAGVIIRAADVSNSASGYRLALQMKETVGSAGTVSATGTGSFNTLRRAGEMSLRMSLPGTAASIGTLDLHEVVKSGIVYMKLPASISGRLPGAKPWVEINLAQAGRAAGVPGLSSLASGGSSNPAQFLQYLRGASTSGVENLGSATVNGVRTTHYRAVVDLAKAASQAPAAQRKSASRAIAALQAQTGLQQLPVDVWIDSAHLVRRMDMTYAMHTPGGTQPIGMHMTIDFTAYGPQPVPATPAPAQVTDLTSLLGSLGGAAGAPGATTTATG